MKALLPILFFVVLLLALNALYVAAEFATVSARRARLKQMALRGNWLAARLLPYVENRKALDDYIAACQIGITASSLALGAYGQRTVAAALQPLLADWGNLAEPAAFSAATTGVLLALTLLQMVVGELFPKSVAAQYRERAATATALPILWSLTLFRPLIWLFNGNANFLLRRLGVHPGESASHAHSPAEIELLAEESRAGGLLDDSEGQMIRNALRLRELTARQVMTPRVRLTAAPLASTLGDLIALCNDSGFTRIPLYHASIDDVAGFVHLKDLLRLAQSGQENVAEIVRGLTPIPQTLPAAEVWARMKARHEYMTVVLDEYGGTAGIITFEDLIEEIFGELQDEFDDKAALAVTDREGKLRLRADLLVEDVNEFLDLQLPTEEADTLGGLVMAALGRVPAEGDEARFGAENPGIRVEAMDGLAVSEVSLRWPDAAPRVAGWETAGRD